MLHASHFVCQTLFFQHGWHVIWVLTAGYGDGHNTAARCVGEALRREAPAEQVIVSDLVSEVHPFLAHLSQSAYRIAIIRFPWAWRAFYQWLARPGIGAKSAAWMQPLLDAMEHRIRTERPPVIVSTYPFYAAALQVLRRKGVPVPPLVTVITDSVTVHPIWMSAPSDLYLVADEETRQVVTGAYGISADKVKVTGFPVSLEFLQAPEAPAADGSRHRVLYFPSTPAHHVAETLEALKPQLLNGVKLTMPVGKHGSRLYHALRRFTDANPAARVELIGWTQRIPELLQTHDLIITKAGGAILHEVLAARIPPVIDYVVPGQEEGNAEMVLKHQCGLRSLTPQETADCVRRLLANDAAEARSLRENMRALSIPDAAVRSARAVLQMAGGGPAAEG